MLDQVRMLSAGFCLHPEFMSIRGGSWRPCRFPAGFACFHHQQHGVILFDTGYSDHFMAETRRFPASLYARLLPPNFQQADRACDQLRRFNISPEDVRAVIVSHFHADHIAGLRDFPKARIICTRSGYLSICGAHTLRGLLKGLLPGLMPPDADDRVDFVEDMDAIDLPAAMAPFGRARDLFGDRSVLVVNLPGHSIGQIGLYLPETQTGSLFLVADAAWSLDAIERRMPPPRLVTSLLGQSRIYLSTLDSLHDLRHSTPELLIRPSHCRTDPGAIA